MIVIGEPRRQLLDDVCSAPELVDIDIVSLEGFYEGYSRAVSWHRMGLNGIDRTCVYTS